MLPFDAVHWYMNELTSRLIVETGVVTDRWHLGKIILQSLKDAPDFVMQIDAATKQSETNQSVLERSLKCAVSMKKAGLEKGDAIVLMGPNHLDLAIPLYAALFLGIKIAALDVALGIEEMTDALKQNCSKMVFCQSDKATVVTTAAESLGMKVKVITFDKNNNSEHFHDFLQKADETEIAAFKPEDFDPEETIAFLTSTSGTTGVPKAAALTHKNLAIAVPYLWSCYSKFPTPTKMIMVASPLQWLSAGFHYLFAPILRITKLKTSSALTTDNFFEMVKNYQPTYIAISPNLMTTYIKSQHKDIGCLTSFETLLLGGSSVPPQLIDEIKEITPHTRVAARYSCSESSGLPMYDEHPPPGSVGRPVGVCFYKLVNVETLEEITEANVHGELWLKGPNMCKGYYNNLEATKEAFTDDGWFRTGDVFYRDEHYYFYFVERLKLLLKYRNHQISPLELESVIRRHPGVADVAVTGVPHPEHGELPVACVVPKNGQKPTADEIKNIVKDSLADSKQLRGGVIFMNELPLTVSTKLHRRKLKELALVLKRE